MKTINTYQPFHFQNLSIQRGLEIIATKNSLLLATETGLGKTIVAATIALNANPKNVLVISPKANQKAWSDIMDKSGLTYTLSGNRAIPNYKTEFDFVIIDEVHKIGTVTSSTYQAIYKLVKYNQSKLISISATPYNNNIESFIDILSLFNLPQNSMEYYLIDFLAGKLFEANYELNLNRRIFGTTLDKMSFSDIGKKVEYQFTFDKHLTLLSEVISGFTIRDKRNSIEVLPTEHLLERFPNTNFLELSASHGKWVFDNNLLKLIDKLCFAWQNQVNYFIPDLNNNFGNIYRTTLFKLMESSLAAFVASIKTSIKTIEAALLMEKIVIGENEYTMTDNFISGLKNDLEVYNSLVNICEANRESNPKAELLFDIINENEGKFVVFTEYTETLNMLSLEAEKRKIPFIAFKSDANESVLDLITKEFDANNHTSDKYKVLICNDVLAEGVSLHYAKHLVHYDSRWNPSRLIQREGRINRICMDGNKHDINIYKFAVPSHINTEIELTEKIERKTSEAEILLNNLKPHAAKKYISTVNNIIVKPVGGENEWGSFSETVGEDVSYAFFLNDKEFISIGNDRILVGGVYNLFPVKQYLEEKAYPGCTYDNISQYAAAVEKYGNIDKRYYHNYNKFSDLRWRNTEKTTRPNNKVAEFSYFIKSSDQKDVAVTEILLTFRGDYKLPIKTFYYPISIIFADRKKDMEKKMKTLEKSEVKAFVESYLLECFTELSELVAKMNDGKRKILKVNVAKLD